MDLAKQFIGLINNMSCIRHTHNTLFTPQFLFLDNTQFNRDDTF